MKIELKKRLAPSGNAEDFDVRQVKGALNRLGYYMPFETIGMNGIPDQRLFDGIVKFQRDHDLDPSGEIAPGDATVRALNKAVSEQKGTYIWHSVNDDRVRADHAELDGTTRDWSDSPDPTEDYNCRCWAELVESKKCFDGGNWMAEALRTLKLHEGNIEYPYLDTKGLITIGVGFNVNEWSQFSSLNLYIEGNEYQIATLQDKRIAETKLRAIYEENKKLITNAKTGETYYRINLEAEHFRDKTNLRIARAEIDTKAQEFISRFTEFLRGKFDDFDCFPAPARVALMDMIWHIGPTNFNGKPDYWPLFFKAVKARDWQKAAKESYRKQKDDKKGQKRKYEDMNQRNQDIYDLFMKAFEMEKGQKDRAT